MPTSATTTIVDSAAHEDRVNRVARLLRGWDSRAEETLPARLAAAMIDLIDQGELGAGLRLPSERRLADTLAISRGTVSAAYSQLKLEGWLDSRVGSGSRVMSLRGRPAADRTRVDGRLATVHLGGAPIDLTSGALPGLPATMTAAQAALRDRLPELLGTHGYEPQGIAELREKIAGYYAELGAPTDSSGVVVTTGSQQALQLLADAYLAPGDTVLVEESTYRGAIEIFHSRGARLVPVPLAVDGPDADGLERLVQRLRPRIVYLLPTAHNPSGYVASPAKAAAIAAILDRSDALFIEDGTPADLVLDRPRPPTPVGVGIDPARWVAIGSISKLFWGGLRVGWVRASDAVIRRLTRVKAAADLGTSLVSQAIAAECLERVEEARAARRRQLLEGLELAEEIIGELAPEWSWQRPRGGSALWVRVPDTDARALAETVQRLGLSIVPGAFFSPIDGFADHLRIPFWADAAELHAGLELLVGAWREGATRPRAGAPADGAGGGT